MDVMTRSIGLRKALAESPRRRLLVVSCEKRRAGE
jgi:hypothetical protein